MSETENGGLATPKLSRNRQPPGRFSCYYAESDSAPESELACYDTTYQKTALKSDLVNQTKAKHELVALSMSPTSDEENQTSHVLDDLVSNDMLYDITIRGLNHLQLNKASVSFLEDLCTARRKKNQLYQKLENLRKERLKLETESKDS